MLWKKINEEKLREIVFVLFNVYFKVVIIRFEKWCWIILFNMYW